MDKQYIIPVVGQIYHNRGGGEYRCTGNRLYMSDEQQRRALSLGDHVAYMERVKDGWSLAAHGADPVWGRQHQVELLYRGALPLLTVHSPSLGQGRRHLNRRLGGVSALCGRSIQAIFRKEEAVWTC